jgi:hypothetical protein
MRRRAKLGVLVLGVVVLTAVDACGDPLAMRTAFVVKEPPATETAGQATTPSGSETVEAPASGVATRAAAEAPNATATPVTPAPDVRRILFAEGKTQATVEGTLPSEGSRTFVLGIAAGQYVEMSATVGATGRGLRFSIVGADGTLVKPMGDAHVRAVVPSTQDYFVELVSGVGPTSYRISVLIPIRVSFEPGGTLAEVKGSVAPGGTRDYVLRTLAGQRLIVVEHVVDGTMRLVISGADGQVLLSGRVAGNGFEGILPVTQDYLISVQGDSTEGAEYVLEITIPAVEATYVRAHGVPGC